MTLKFSAAFNFAAFVFCSLLTFKLDPGSGLLVVIIIAALNGFFFIFNFCRFAEAIIAPRTDPNAKVNASPVNGTPS